METKVKTRFRTREARKDEAEINVPYKQVNSLYRSVMWFILWVFIINGAMNVLNLTLILRLMD